MRPSAPALRRASIDAAIIDLDGTLVDTLGDFEAAIARMSAELGLPAVPREFIARSIGWGSEHLVRAVLQHTGAAPSAFDGAWVSYQRGYLAVNGAHSRIFPGVVEALDRFSASGLKLACVTNKPGAFTAPLLARLALDRYFDVVYGGDAFARRKPDPMPLIEACAALGTEPARTLMIGDSAVDAQAARGAGCRLALVRYGFSHGQPLEALGADQLLDRIDELFA
jgi:phosphoglycolate phosphatase